MEWKFEFELGNFEKLVEEIEKEANLLRKEIESNSILERIRKIEDLVDEFGKYSQIAYMRYSVDTGSTENQKFLGKIQQSESKLSEIFSSFKIYLNSLDEKTLKQVIEIEPNYKHFITNILEEKPHLLSEEAEKVLALTNPTRREAAGKTYTRLTSSYTFELEVDGEIKKLTSSQIRSLRLRPEKELRKKAMKVYFERFQKDSIVIEELYNTIVNDYITESRLRKFEKPVSMANFHKEVDDETVELVSKITDENVNILQNYYRWKSKFMGEELTLADIYAPLKPVQRKFTFEEAKEIVLSAFGEFSQNFRKIAQQFFDEGRIDVYPREKKVSGAYCIYNSTKMKPYILLNFNGNISDVMTLAHELGHGIHGVLSQKQTYFNYHSSLNLAEVASVFAEFLTYNKLKEILSEEDKMLLTASKLEETFATMFRQNTFYEFEMKAFELIEKNNYASFEELSNIYEELLQKTFGDSVIIPEEYKIEWSSIPHLFETPFYVYSYNFANGLVLGLYMKYLKEGKEFLPKYVRILESGGNEKPEKILSEVGIDPKVPEFWKGAFEFVRKMGWGS